MMKRIALLMILCCVSVGLGQTQAAKVTFREDGISLVSGKPFFPIGIWTYEINTNVLADLHEHQFNVVIGNGFEPRHLDVFYNHGLMAVPPVNEEFLKVGIGHPSVLAWLLIDEPEGKRKPDEVRKDYEAT